MTCAGERAAHRHPVEELDALRAGVLDQIVDRVARQRFGVGDELVQAELSNSLLMKPARLPSS